MAEIKHFLDLDFYGPGTLRSILDQGFAFKQGIGNPSTSAGEDPGPDFRKALDTDTRIFRGWHAGTGWPSDCS